MWKNTRVKVDPRTTTNKVHAWAAVAFLLIAATARAQNSSANPVYKPDTNDIFWFVHISDTHVGVWGAQPGPVERAEDALQAALVSITQNHG